LEVFKGEIIKVWDEDEYKSHWDYLNHKSCENLMKIMSGFNVKYNKKVEIKCKQAGFDKAKKWTVLGDNT
jgi:hypothetical protein